MVRALALCSLVLAFTPVAIAGPRVVSGGPSGAAKAAFGKSLDQTAGMLAVCWRGKRPATVRIALDVGANGAVRTATAKTAGKVAACAAGVLAVQTLAKARRSYRATVEFSTRGGGGSAGASVRDAVARGITGNPALRACYDGVSGLSGSVQIRFMVRPDGRVVDAEALSSTVAPKSVVACLVRTIGGAKLGALDTSKSVEFTLPFSFDGTGNTAQGGGDPALRPQKNGPMANDALDRVMKPALPKFTACYDKQARGNPELAGDVVVRFTIRADGTTRNVKVKRTTLGNAKVEACMVAVGKSLRFPAERGRKDTKVIYPFRFSQTR